MVKRQVSEYLPPISALLPAKNGEKYLTQLVPRILMMLKESDELLVVNDGSTDNSASVLAKLAKDNTRLTVINTDGVGLVAALNLGIEKAMNTWIARFDVDDEYPLDRIHLQRQLIGEDVAVVFSDYSFISSGGVWLGTVPSAIISNPTKLSLVSSQRTPHPAALLNKSLVLSVGGYRAEEFPAEDLGLWLRMVEVGKFVTVPEILLRYRLVGGSVSSSNRRKQLIKKDQLLSEFFGWKVLLENCVQEFSITSACYLNHQKSTTRLILHLWDIYKVSKISGLRVSVFKLLVTLPFFSLIQILFCLPRILAMSIFRKIYRLSKTFF